MLFYISGRKKKKGLCVVLFTFQFVRVWWWWCGGGGGGGVCGCVTTTGVLLTNIHLHHKCSKDM